MKYIFIIVSTLFFHSCSTSDESQNSSENFRVKTLTPKIKIGGPIVGEIKNNSFGAVTYYVFYNGDTVNKFDGNVEKMNLSLTFKTVGKKNISIIGVNESGQIKKKLMKVEVFSDIVPQKKAVKIIKEYPHNISNYTQGLFFAGDTLFEGTGLYGESKIEKYFLTKPEVINSQLIDSNLFGEGITKLGDKLYQLTWKSGKVLVYDLDFNLLNELVLPFKAEGWGITSNGTELIMSDGTEKIRVLNPVNLELTSEISVYDNQRKLSMLNELELVGDKLYANIYQSNYIVEIDLESGKVISYLDCTHLRDNIEINADTDVLNGIAFNENLQSFFVTGKKWNKVFEISF